MLLLIFAFAFLIRLIALDQSLWLDEATTANVVKNLNFSGILQQFSPHDFHPPLFYFLMELWTSIFGYSEISLRFPSIIFSLLTGWFVYLIGKEIKNRRIGIWAAAFFLFNPLVIYYSQEARMYMMATFFLTGALYYFLRIIKTTVIASEAKQSDKKQIASSSSTPRNDALLFNLFTFLSFLTFYGSIFLIASFYLILLIKKRFSLMAKLVPGFILAFLLVSPLLYKQYSGSQEALRVVKNWSLVLGKANLKNLLLIPIKFSIGRISFEPKIVYFIMSFIWTIFVFFRVLVNGMKNKQLLLLFLTPLLLGLIISFFTPLLQYFRFIYLIPILSLLLAWKGQKWLNFALLAGFLAFSLLYLLNPQFHREDWKSLTATLPKNKPVYMILSSSDPVRYYDSNIKLKELRELKDPEKEIVIIPYTAEIYDFDYSNKLKELRYSKKELKTFRGLSYEVWSK